MGTYHHNCLHQQKKNIPFSRIALFARKKKWKCSSHWKEISDRHVTFNALMGFNLFPPHRTHHKHATVKLFLVRRPKRGDDVRKFLHMLNAKRNWRWTLIDSDAYTWWNPFWAKQEEVRKFRPWFPQAWEEGSHWTKFSLKKKSWSQYFKQFALTDRPHRNKASLNSNQQYCPSDVLIHYALPELHFYDTIKWTSSIKMSLLSATQLHFHIIRSLNCINIKRNGQASLVIQDFQPHHH